MRFLRFAFLIEKSLFLSPIIKITLLLAHSTLAVSTAQLFGSGTKCFSLKLRVMAEAQGFEPRDPCGVAGFQDRCFRPLSQTSISGAYAPIERSSYIVARMSATSV